MSEDESVWAQVLIAVAAIAAVVAAVYHFYFNVLGHRGHPFTRYGWLQLQREASDRDAERRRRVDDSVFKMETAEVDAFIGQMEEELATSHMDILDVTMQYSYVVRLAALERHVKRLQLKLAQ